MTCILCDSNEIEEAPDDIKDILICNRCDARFWAKYKTESYDYEKYDELYLPIRQTCIEIKNYPNPVKRVQKRGIPYERVLDYFLKQDDPISILDVGCGYGYVAWALKTLQFDITGIDISRKAIEFAKKTFDLPFHAIDIHKYKEKHDIIISIETIEHVNNPRKFIKDCLKVAPKLILTTPNPEYHKKTWISEEPPIHIACYTKKSFEYLAYQLNVSVEIEFDGANLIVIYETKPNI